MNMNDVGIQILSKLMDDYLDHVEKNPEADPDLLNMSREIMLSEESKNRTQLQNILMNYWSTMAVVFAANKARSFVGEFAGVLADDLEEVEEEE